MISLLSRERVRAFDAEASRAGGVPAEVLMEKAGEGAALVVLGLLSAARSEAVLVVCGPGNNGGDGLVVARHLRAAGVEVMVALAVDEGSFKGAARLKLEAYREAGGAPEVLLGARGESRLRELLAQSAVVIDALFGTGLERPLSMALSAWITAINQASALRVALDIPSGLDADTGEPRGCAVQAHHTVTFVGPKLGLATTKGLAFGGQLHVVGIGVPAPDPEGPWVSAIALELGDVAGLLPARSRVMHKGQAGRVALVAGSQERPGAALLAARGALRAGAGLVTIVGSSDTTRACAGHLPEVMTLPVDGPRGGEQALERALAGVDAVVVGPGLGVSAAAEALVRSVLSGFEGPLVLDADGLNLFAGRASELKAARARLIITPHPREAARLLGSDVAHIEQDRFAALAALVQATSATVLLKGPRTLVGAPGARPRVNFTGSPVLAVGGAGDVLAGLIAALAVKLAPLDAAACGAFIHGLSAERWAEGSGADRGMLAHELADGLVGAFAVLARERRKLTE